VGDGKDFVGPCINTASRLQKLSQLSFAFSRKGINPDLCFSAAAAQAFIVKQVELRGIGEQELVVLNKSEFESLPPEEQDLFADP
jgi:hypothetical protein